MTQAISLVLPMPPSINEAYRNVPGVGRVKTSKCRSWIAWAAFEMKRQARGSIAGAYAIHVEIDRPDNRRRDLSNFLKVLEDTIVAQGLVEDDSLCERIKMRWTQKIEGRPGPVRVWLIATTGDDSDE